MPVGKKTSLGFWSGEVKHKLKIFRAFLTHAFVYMFFACQLSAPCT